MKGDKISLTVSFENRDVGNEILVVFITVKLGYERVMVWIPPLETFNNLSYVINKFCSALISKILNTFLCFRTQWLKTGPCC